MIEVSQTISFISFFGIAFIALITIMNPFSTASIFIAITKGETKKKRKLIAKKACTTAALVLLTFALAGNLILFFFGITVDAFRIAGGILVTQVGFGMLKSINDGNESIRTKEAAKKEDVTLIPLAIPMLSGPGAMTTAIVLMGEAGGWKEANFLLVGSLVLAIISVSIISYFILRQSLMIDKYLGKNELAVIDKILGLIVLVIGIQFIINGVIGVLSLLN